MEGDQVVILAGDTMVEVMVLLIVLIQEDIVGATLVHL